jgi:hypothetical protein
MAGENRGWIIRGNSAKTMPFMAAPRTGAASTGSRRPAPHPWPCSDGRTRRHRVRDRHHPDAATRHGRGGGVDLRQEVMSPFTPWIGCGTQSLVRGAPNGAERARWPNPRADLGNASGARPCFPARSFPSTR